MTVGQAQWSDDLCINVQQSISVHIPEESSIEEDAVYENHKSYKESLSVHNVLIKSRDAPEKISFADHLEEQAKSSKVTVEQVLEKISIELAFVATQDSLVKHYAYPVSLLDKVKQQELVEQLQKLGFTVTLDTPFICEKFVGLVNGFNEDFSKQHVLIDLP